MKLTAFANNKIKTIEEFDKYLKETTIVIPSFFMKPPKAEEKTEQADLPLRQQVLRYYNANPDLFEIVLVNFNTWISHFKPNTTLDEISHELAKSDNSLTVLDNDDDVSIIENFMFGFWPIVDRIVKLNPGRVKPDRIIQDTRVAFDMCDFMRAWIEHNNEQEDKEHIPHHRYLDYIVR